MNTLTNVETQFASETSAKRPSSEAVTAAQLPGPVDEMFYQGIIAHGPSAEATKLEGKHYDVYIGELKSAEITFPESWEINPPVDIAATIKMRVPVTKLRPKSRL